MKLWRPSLTTCYLHEYLVLYFIRNLLNSDVLSRWHLGSPLNEKRCSGEIRHCYFLLVQPSRFLCCINCAWLKTGSDNPKQNSSWICLARMVTSWSHRIVAGRWLVEALFCRFISVREITMRLPGHVPPWRERFSINPFVSGTGRVSWNWVQGRFYHKSIQSVVTQLELRFTSHCKFISLAVHQSEQREQNYLSMRWWW